MSLKNVFHLLEWIIISIELLFCVFILADDDRRSSSSEGSEQQQGLLTDQDREQSQASSHGM